MNEVIEYFSSYRHQARKFMTVPEENLHAYIPLGLCGEAGEVCDKVKKIIRDTSFDVNNPTTWSPEVTNDLLLELGDVCWYVAALADFYNLGLAHVNEVFESQSDLLVLDRKRETHLYALQLSSVCNKLSRSYLLQDITTHISSILFIITIFAMHLDTEIYDIFRMNISKLSSRQSRGQLSGSGDHR